MFVYCTQPVFLMILSIQQTLCVCLSYATCVSYDFVGTPNFVFVYRTQTVFLMILSVHQTLCVCLSYANCISYYFVGTPNFVCLFIVRKLYFLLFCRYTKLCVFVYRTQPVFLMILSVHHLNSLCNHPGGGRGTAHCD